jgi:hypothetical protein
MTTPERQLADLFVADGREPNRGWWAASPTAGPTPVLPLLAGLEL